MADLPNNTAPESQSQQGASSEQAASDHASGCTCVVCQIAGGSSCTESYALLDDM